MSQPMYRDVTKFLLCCLMMALAAQSRCCATADEPAWSAALMEVPQGLGVNIHFITPPAGEIPMIANAGFTWIRMDFLWEVTETKRGQYDFSQYDALVNALKAAHMRAIFILDLGNPLYDHGGPPATDASRSAFTKWAVAAAAHFGGDGIIWELWNEPNAGFWEPKTNVIRDYSKLAAVVGTALHEANPDEIFVGPALNHLDMKFLEDCLKAGCLQYWQAVTVHPYTKTPESGIDGYARLGALIAKYAPQGSSRTIIAGEWGYTSRLGEHTVAEQGQLLAREFLINLSARIPLSIWYDWSDDGADRQNSEHNYGLVHYEYDPNRNPVREPKPAYIAAKTLMHILAGSHFDQRLSAGDSDDYVLQFRRGDEVLYAAWTTAKTPRMIHLPLSGGALSATSTLGQPLPALPAVNGQATVTLTESPQYLTSGK
jgi:polysaccharide biosynthesis protein PslG